MKKILTILLLAVSLIAEADKWYIATAANGGSDTNGDGSISAPWLTLKHACDTITGVAFVGDTIVVGEGTFTETAQSALGVGVSIYGAGETSIITSDAALNPLILLSSSTQGTDGSQSISYLAFDGNSYTALGAIMVDRRSNVDIHNCTFNEFGRTAAIYQGSTSGEPTTYATDNTFHDNTVYDCGGPWSSYGNLQIAGQQDMLIYNNNIEQIDRGENLWGFPIKFKNNGFLKGIKIYNNKLITPAPGLSEWHIAIELWCTRGGIEIYDNEVMGKIDFGGQIYDASNDEGGYGYNAKVYNNVIYGGHAAVDYETSGVTMERTVKGGVYIYNNLIYNVQYGITISNLIYGNEKSDVNIYHNIIHTVGRTDGIVGAGIWVGTDSDTVTNATVSNINILNNTIVTNGGRAPRGIWLKGSLVAFDNITIRNNIVTGVVMGGANGIYLYDIVVDYVSIENNCLYDNGTDINTATATLTNETIQNNLLATDPLFVSSSDFRLQSISPCINAGLSVGLTSDFAGHRVPQNDTVDIGAYEYGDYLFRTPSGKLLRNANGKLMITH